MKHRTGLKVMAATLAAAVPLASHAAISLTTTSYTQSFDSLPSAGGATGWANDLTLPGWSLFSQPEPGTPITGIGVNNGGSATGAFYSYGSTNQSDRALGGLGSGGTYFGSPANGAPAGAIVVAFTNDTGQTIGSVSVSFNGEQWRNGGNPTPQTMVLQYGIGDDIGSVNWFPPPHGNFDWTSPVATDTAGALNGNLAANRVAGRGGTVQTSWQPGQTAWIRWIERNDFGNDHGLAIDDFSLTVTPIPEPSSIALFAAGAALLGVVQMRRRAAGR